jgi:hypothetical protein
MYELAGHVHYLQRNESSRRTAIASHAIYLLGFHKKKEKEKEKKKWQCNVVAFNREHVGGVTTTFHPVYPYHPSQMQIRQFSRLPKFYFADLVK